MSEGHTSGRRDLPQPRAELTRKHDRGYDPDQHGSDPMGTISVKRNGPAVWPVIWAVVPIAMIALTLYLLFG